MKKELIYYFYCDTYEIPEIYKVHISCINMYNDIFFKYTLLLSFDNPNDEKLVNHWKNIFKKYIKTNKTIQFEILQNNSNYREGIHFYNYIFKNFDKFDGLVLWGHGKRDFSCDQNIIAEWIVFIHTQLSYINEIEKKFIYDKYCSIGSLLTSDLDIYEQKFNFSNCYCGSFYWIYPQKIFYKFKENLEFLISKLDSFIENDNHWKLKGISEMWFNVFFNKEDLYAMYQYNPICTMPYLSKNGSLITTFSLYLHSINNIKHHFDNKLFEDWEKNKNKIFEKIKLIKNI